MSRGRRASIRQLFGRRLHALRRLRGMTQEELGERSDVSGKLVGQIERGTGNPTLEVIAGLADRNAVMHHGRLLACDTPVAIMGDRAVQEAYVGEAL